MPEPKWVKAEDLVLNDEIRFEQEIWDTDKNKWTGRSRQIQGRIVNLGQQKVTLLTSEGLIVKKITTIEKVSQQDWREETKAIVSRRSGSGNLRSGTCTTQSSIRWCNRLPWTIAAKDVWTD
jgi:hypothetical protein